jgi:hypothetical protein
MTTRTLVNDIVILSNLTFIVMESTSAISFSSPEKFAVAGNYAAQPLCHDDYQTP